MPASTASSTSRGSRACAASATSSTTMCDGTCSRAEECSRPPPPPARGSSSRPRRRSTEMRSGIRRPKRPSLARSPPTGSRSSGASSSLMPMRRASGSTRSSCATSPSTDRVSGPTWRSRASSTRSRAAPRSSSTATGSSRARSRTLPTGWRRRWRRWSAPRRVPSTTWAAARRRRCARRTGVGPHARPGRASRGRGRRAAHRGGREEDRARARLACDDLVARRFASPVGMGLR